MKKTILPFITLTIACFQTIVIKVNAQCTVSVTGDHCITSILTANFSGAAADTVKWYRDGVLAQVKTKRNPFAIVVAGGGSGEAGQLSGPQDVFVDAAGNIYVVDDGRQRVQKWAPGAASGVTVAGGNGKGSALNQFFTPKGIAVDNAGNVYVSDDLMARVTRWAPGALSGVVVAGGNGEGSGANQLFGPQNICLDNAGNIYIADRWNDRIQKWAPGATSGVTVAGGNGRGGAANQFSEPLDVGVDAAGNVYVTDYFNNRVQKWTPGATSGTTVAGGNGQGSAADQFSFTTALHVLPNGTLYVRDQNNYRVQKWVAGAGYGATVAGGYGSGSELNKVNPGFGLFADNADNIYVPGLFENTVNKFIPAATADMQLMAVIPGNYVAAVKAKNICSARSPQFTVETVPAKPERMVGPNSVSPGQTGLVYRVQKNAGHTYTWTVPGDATILDGQGTFRILVTWGSSNGTITVTESGPCGTSPAKLKNVFVSGAALAAVDINNLSAQPSERNMRIYPNPVTTGTNLNFTASKNSFAFVEVSDAAGKLLITRKYTTQQGANNYFINMDKLGAGMYFIKVRTGDNETQVFKCIKK